MLRLFPQFRIFKQGNQVVWLIIALHKNLYTDQYGLGGREKKREIKKKIKKKVGGGGGGGNQRGGGTGQVLYRRGSSPAPLWPGWETTSPSIAVALSA